jgi:hypothetical protein
MLPEDYSEPTVKVPPQLTPFKPGQSGNPNGRPKGSKNRSTIAKEFAAIVTGGLNVKGDTDPNMTAEELMIATLWRKAFDGDITAIKEIQDTLYGKLTDKTIEVKPETMDADFTAEVLAHMTTEQIEAALASKNNREPS